MIIASFHIHGRPGAKRTEPGISFASRHHVAVDVTVIPHHGLPALHNSQLEGKNRLTEHHLRAHHWTFSPSPLALIGNLKSVLENLTLLALAHTISMLETWFT